MSELSPSIIFFFFFFNDTATTEIYTLSLHDALPIFGAVIGEWFGARRGIGVLLVSSMQNLQVEQLWAAALAAADRKSTRLNSSHGYISYAVFCLKKKKIKCTTLITAHDSSCCTSRSR